MTRHFDPKTQYFSKTQVWGLVGVAALLISAMIALAHAQSIQEKENVSVRTDKEVSVLR